MNGPGWYSTLQLGTAVPDFLNVNVTLSRQSTFVTATLVRSAAGWAEVVTFASDVPVFGHVWLVVVDAITVGVGGGVAAGGVVDVVDELARVVVEADTSFLSLPHAPRTKTRHDTAIAIRRMHASCHRRRRAKTLPVRSRVHTRYALRGAPVGNDLRPRRRHRRSRPLAARTPQRRTRDGAPGRPARDRAAHGHRSLRHRSRPRRPGARRLRQPGRRADVQHRAQRVAECRPADGGRRKHRRRAMRVVTAGHEPRGRAREVGCCRRRARLWRRVDEPDPARRRDAWRLRAPDDGLVPRAL